MPRIDFAQMPTQVSGPLDLHAHPQLFDALPLAVLVCDREGRLVTGNAGARELWGDALEPGVHADDLLSPPPDGNGLTTTRPRACLPVVTRCTA
ncbi:PAS domain-containing protein [Frateuria hangzhouensis]|uniref:PAS domain-containing protein n=1 Tax=Frateuria hangzhouensis TaxID=2995589 RepID=UPI002260830F|nr:PAS domain-containing protein [Frateuria sp. STR12]MCX7513631.1 PAS domain-containing protein [Frateuria sp. STR12]